jgi:hypothetical protein
VSSRDLHEGGNFWKRVEFAALAAGLAGSATACAAGYNWHLFRESLFFMLFSAAPFVLFALIGHIARKTIRSAVMPPISALFAVALTIFSLIVYIKAVLYPNHSSGLVFAIVPLISMAAVAAGLIGIVMGAAAASLHGNKQE